MRFGISFANLAPFNTPAEAVEMARAAEEAGFESLWTVEHIVWPSSYSSAYPYSSSGKMRGDPATSIPDSLIWLSWVGAQTSRIRLGTGILILPQRNPLITAKALATLDDLSGGRVEAGIGVGWLREEFEALGVPFERRGARTDEYIEAMRTVWSQDGAAFDGEFVRFTDANVNPKPKRREISITIGGHSAAAARRAGRLGDGLFPGRTDIAHLSELFGIAQETAVQNDRDPNEIMLSAGLRLGRPSDVSRTIDELTDLGVTRLVVPGFALRRPDLETAMGQMAELIAAHSQ